MKIFGGIIWLALGYFLGLVAWSVRDDARWFAAAVAIISGSMFFRGGQDLFLAGLGRVPNTLRSVLRQNAVYETLGSVKLEDVTHAVILRDGG